MAGNRGKRFREVAQKFEDIEGVQVSEPDLDAPHPIQEHDNAMRPLNEAKLVLLGSAGVGKTALVDRLVHDSFYQTTTTRGIQITPWEISVGKEAMKIHVWDFGGQQIQHGTFRLFLTRYSLYLVVLNGRGEPEDQDAEYWLRYVQAFGKSSPVFIVLNGVGSRPSSLNRRRILEKYPFIMGIFEIDCESGYGLKLLRQEIADAISKLEGVKVPFPAKWVRIKNELSQLRQPFIDFQSYKNLCAIFGETDEHMQVALSAHLNTLGIALNFWDDPTFFLSPILNPHWLLEGV